MQNCQQGPPNGSPRGRPRLTWLAVLGVILFAMYLANGMTPSFSWQGLMDLWSIHDTDRFTMLATFGVIGVVVCLVMRVLRNTNDE
jgi:hypothetical protein